MVLTKHAVAIALTLALSPAIALYPAASAYAGDSPDEIKLRKGAGDPVAGKEKSAMCQGCHGEDGNSAAPSFPKLSGQFANYLQKQIHDFQGNSRSDPMMSGMAAGLTDKQDLLDISAYFASQKQMKGASPVVNEVGRSRYLDDNGCVNCHGANGKGKADPITPAIGGQHKEYLIKQLNDFKSGARNNENSGMMSMIAGFMDDAEIEAVADYLSGL